MEVNVLFFLHQEIRTSSSTNIEKTPRVYYSLFVFKASEGAGNNSVIKKPVCSSEPNKGHLPITGYESMSGIFDFRGFLLFQRYECRHRVVNLKQIH